MIDLLAVGLGGAVGAAARFLVGRLLQSRPFFVPTVAVNVVGSFLFGLLVASGVRDPVLLFLGVGFCGAFTTFATFAVDTVRLWDDRPVAAVVYATGTLSLCLVAAAIAGTLALIL